MPDAVNYATARYRTQNEQLHARAAAWLERSGQWRPLVRAYNSTNFEDVLLSGDVWVAQGWSGQFAKAMEASPNAGKRHGALLVEGWICQKFRTAGPFGLTVPGTMA